MATILPPLRRQAVDIATLSPHPKNPRNGDVDRIRESLEAHGQYRTIGFQKSTGYVIYGNHTYAAAMELGWPKIAAVALDVDDQEAEKIMVVDNATADAARNDDALLAEVLSGFDDLSGTGVTDREFKALLDGLNAPVEFPEHDVAPGGGDPATVTCPECSHAFVP